MANPPFNMSVWWDAKLEGDPRWRYGTKVQVVSGIRRSSSDMPIASLWFDIEAPAIATPAVTREQALPFGSLSWENFERICFRLAHRDGDVEDARIYGERGQAQEGIDLYVRRATGDYATWQCKRYQEVTTTNIKDAVTKFLEGDWAARTKVFRLAVAPSLNATELAEEIERQRVRCDAANIVFEPLDRDRLSLMLKEHPDLVDDFFGRPWVEAFNGAEALVSLSGRKLSREQKITCTSFCPDAVCHSFPNRRRWHTGSSSSLPGRRQESAGLRALCRTHHRACRICS